jgi:hypothetical protein
MIDHNTYLKHCHSDLRHLSFTYMWVIFTIKKKRVRGSGTRGALLGLAVRRQKALLMVQSWFDIFAHDV